MILDEFDTEGRKLIVWSDGPCSQFKNRYIAKALKHITEMYHLSSMEWAFFATAHGKGPVDGLGGSAKRLVRKAVLRESGQVGNAEQFASVAQQEIDNIRFLVSNNECFPEFISRLENASPIKNITKCHFFSWNDENLVTRELK